jgi:hypothetical protein
MIHNSYPKKRTIVSKQVTLSLIIYEKNTKNTQQGIIYIFSGNIDLKLTLIWSHLCIVNEREIFPAKKINILS